MNITVDIIGALLSLISGYFYIKEKSFAWLISLSAIPFDVVMDLQIGVYGDLLLQIVYFIILLYGWMMWRKGTIIEEVLPISRISLKQACKLILLTSISFVSIWALINLYTTSTVAVLDSSVTVLSVLACWMLCRKLIESWLLWVIVDTLYIILYIHKQMPFHAFMALVDSIMCMIGYTCWIREYSNTLKQNVAWVRQEAA